MQLWILLAASALGLLLILLLAALEIEFDLRALGEANGGYAAAFGMVVAGVVFSGVYAKQQPLRLEVRVFGKQISLSERWRRRTPRKKPAPEKPAPKPSRPSKWPRIGVVEAIEFALVETRRFRLMRADVDLDYGFEDIALTGRLAGALYALSGALPPHVRLNQNVRWDGAERWELGASGLFALWPGRVLFDLIWYMLRTRLGGAKPGASASNSAPSEIGRHAA